MQENREGRKKLAERVLADPTVFPPKFTSWIVGIINRSPSITVPAAQVSGLNFNDIRTDAINTAWPIGSIFISTENTNPGDDDSLGIGTWDSFAADLTTPPETVYMWKRTS